MAFDPETANPDLVIRGGTVADGRGGDLFEADVAIKDGRIAEIGKVLGKGTEEIDARGKLVTPGFVDVHTHYDGQVTWSQDITPSSQNGVTTAIMGNCGVGFAPCRPDDHFRLIQLMEGVEDIPEPVLSAGIPWSWESFPDYMDWLSKRNFDIDIGAQLPHAALRVYVMGERGARRDPSTQEDNKAMAALAREAVRAGALGFSTSRTLNHRTSTGDFTPTLKAGEDELTAIAEAMHGQGRSVLQFVLDLSSLDEDLPMMLRVAENTRCPITFSITQNDKAPRRWRQTLDEINAAAARGLSITAQIAARPVGLLLGLELSRNPFQTHPSYRAIAKLPLERAVETTAPAGRARGNPERKPDAQPTTRCSSGRTTKRCICSATRRITNSRLRTRSGRRPVAREASRKNWPMTRCCRTRGAACSTCRSSIIPTAISMPRAKCCRIRARCRA